MFASVAIGGLSALAAALIRLGFRGLQYLLTGSSADPPEAAFHLSLWRRTLTPVVGAVLATAVLWAQQRQYRRQNRMPQPYVEYVEAVRHRHGCVPLPPNLWRTLSAAFSVASGAAVGREGSMIQFAAAVASTIGRWRAWLNPDNPAELSFFVACGVAGGVTTAYNAPLAAVFFAAEIVLGGFQSRELPLLAAAAGTGWLISGTLLGRQPLYPLHATLAWDPHLLLLLAVPLILGFAGPAYQWLLSAGRALRRLPAALLWSGLLVGLCSVLDPRVWGNGDVGLSAAFGTARLPGMALSTPALARVLAFRLLATSACVWTGTVGGVFTPTLFLGGALGALLGQAVGGEHAALWAVAGMSCLLAAVTHAPLMATFITAELTGDWRLLALVLPLNVVAWLIARRLSPRALYAIASQAPAHLPGEQPGRAGTVQ